VKSDDERHEPSNFRFLAEDYFNAAVCLMELRERQKLSLRFKHVVPYYLYTHAFELAFKALLRAHGITKRELASKKYGHDLEKLLEASEAKGLVVDEHGKLVVSWLNTFVSDQAFRYLRTGFHSAPVGRDIERAYQNIIKAVGRICDDVRDQSQ
jgi:hypothetical protein